MDHKLGALNIRLTFSQFWRLHGQGQQVKDCGRESLLCLSQNFLRFIVFFSCVLGYINIALASAYCS